LLNPHHHRFQFFEYLFGEYHTLGATAPRSVAKLYHQLKVTGLTTKEIVSAATVKFAAAISQGRSTSLVCSETRRVRARSLNVAHFAKTTACYGSIRKAMPNLE
jgi:hypothetical protein